MVNLSSRNKRVIKKSVSYFFLVLFSAFFLFPLVVMVLRSFFTTEESIAIGAGLIPDTWNWDSYAQALDSEFLKYLGNTVIVLAANIIGQPLTAAMAAYAFTKVKFSGRKIVFTAAMCTIMLPSILTMIPVYKIFVDLGWTNSLLPITVPAFFGGGFLNIFLMMQFIRGRPRRWTRRR